ncbi:MAG: hypothetical protein HPY50_22290 [Firmicutes bacterium]|nr:hypothetical protein [Bacillota bacterium]
MNTQQEAVANNLKLFLGKNQGVRIGESALLSRKVHQDTSKPGYLQVLIDQDAGQMIMGMAQPNQVVHIDIYHDAAELTVLPLARSLYDAIFMFMEERKDENFVNVPATERFTQPHELTNRICLGTGNNQGTVTSLLRGKMDSRGGCDEELSDHVHLLLDLPERWYVLIYDLVVAVETEILRQGVQIRRVNGFTNSFSKCSGGKLKINQSVVDFFKRQRAS